MQSNQAYLNLFYKSITFEGNAIPAVTRTPITRAELITISIVTTIFGTTPRPILTCDVGYLCANFGLLIDLSVLNLGPMYATDRQTSDRQT